MSAPENDSSVVSRVRSWFSSWFAPEPPCVNEKCAGYGSDYCPCADIDAWTSH